MHTRTYIRTHMYMYKHSYLHKKALTQVQKDKPHIKMKFSHKNGKDQKLQ